MIIYFFPFIAGFLGWLFFALFLHLFFNKKLSAGFTFKNILRVYKPTLAKEIGIYVSENILNTDVLTQKISGSEVVQSLKPEIEKNVAHFLNERLKEKWPMIGMFLNEQTLGKMKTGLMEELESALPKLLLQLATACTRNIDTAAFITKKILDIPEEAIQNTIRTRFRHLFRKFLLAGAVMGLMIGLTLCLLLKIFTM